MALAATVGLVLAASAAVVCGADIRATTPDGRTAILHDDGTWEWDAQQGGSSEFSSVGGGIYVGKVTLRTDRRTPELLGEVQNREGEDYRLVLLQVTFYDEAGSLVGSESVSVRQLSRGGSKSFNLPLFEIDAQSVERYRISFDGGM